MKKGEEIFVEQKATIVDEMCPNKSFISSLSCERENYNFWFNKLN